MDNFIDLSVHENYWEKDYNCATNVLMLLSELKGIKLQTQVLQSISGLHGVNPLIAQCGLLTGSLMFLGIYGREKNIPNPQLKRYYYEYSKYFQRRFGHTLCNDLKKVKDSKSSPPFVCEALTKDIVKFTLEYVDKNFKL